MPANEIVLYITLGFMRYALRHGYGSQYQSAANLKMKSKKKRKTMQQEKPISIDLARKVSRYML